MGAVIKGAMKKMAVINIEKTNAYYFEKKY